MFVLTEHTPNPDALKFVPHVKLTAGASGWFEPDRFAPEDAPLAARLFALDGVRKVFIAPDFVTVTRAQGGPLWPDLRYQVIAAIAEHLQAGRPVMAETAAGPAPAEDEEDEVVADIRQVLGLHVRPGVARDGGDVLFERFEPSTGVVHVRLQGACGGCPSSRLTLKSGIEQILRRYVPEVTRVEEIPAEPSDPPAVRWKALAKAAGEGAASRVKTLFTHAGREIPRQDA